ncbi:site-specific integrase [Vibrio algarum]|uniref:Uncharacterized protein n=1 Tax=Vibrio algarum TaxID=3020714 RepID=A0ABT4YMK6_9VIBR|nr:hypothetical protein [Vibrio sp. KJ40-1]MDB1122733.1 hypothetical protein [Vibrio sp. KJ40-1]
MLLNGMMIFEKLKHNEAWTLHYLRRTMVTRLNDLGVYPHVADHLLGHIVSPLSHSASALNSRACLIRVFLVVIVNLVSNYSLNSVSKISGADHFIILDRSGYIKVRSNSTFSRS